MKSNSYIITENYWIMRTIFTLSILLIGFSTYAQRQDCGNDIIEHSLFASEQDYIKHYQTINSTINNQVQNQIALRNAEVDTFDVVFHVIHLGEPLGTGTNLSEEQILSTLVALNRDFRAIPIHDSIAISPNGTDSEIFFRAACIDPDGNSTNGIVRKDGSLITDFTQDGIQISTPQDNGNIYEVMDSSRWSEDRYINVYISHAIKVVMNGNQIGAAGFGPISQWWQYEIGGVFLTPTRVGVDVDGSLGYNISNPYNKLASHEMGHYFGLWHTFQGMSCDETDCTTQGDGVCDTEPHDNSSPFPMDTSCNEFNECVNREPIENLMNYAGQNCGHVFTPGQKDRMKGVIHEHLSGLVNHLSCDMTAGLESEVDNFGIEMYPNPILDELYISSDKNAELYLYNLEGLQIMEIRISDGLTKIHLAHLNAGFYLIKGNIGNSFYSKKLIKI